MMSVARTLLLACLPVLLACWREPKLPPLPDTRQLTFEGTLPEGFTLSGLAVLRATKKTSECFGTIDWLLRNTLFRDQQGYPLRDLKNPTFERLEENRYRLHFLFQPSDLGGPCRWQLQTVGVVAMLPEWKGDPTQYVGMDVYSPAGRSLDTDTELWTSQAKLPPERLSIECLRPSWGNLNKVCERPVPDDQGIPMFKGSLTIPMDIYVPGGIAAARTRMRKERALFDEDMACNDVGRELQRAEYDLRLLAEAEDAGTLDASPQQVELERAQLEKERVRLAASSAACEATLENKRKAIVEEYERTREPTPDAGVMLDAGSPTDGSAH